jgi:DNA-binding MarR family transcriptional regulator
MPYSEPDILSLPLGRHFAVLSKIYYGAFTKMLEQPDLDKYFTVLLMIERLKERCTQQCLANMGQIDKAQITHILDELTAKQYVVKAQNPRDRREYLIELTPKGKAMITKIEAVMQQLYEHAMKDIPEEDRKTFLYVLETFYKNLSALPANPVHIQVISNKKHRK